MRDLLDLEGRVAVITGAGQGVGRHVALRFAEYGAGTVVVNDLFAERAERVAAEVRERGARAIAVETDVTDEHGVQRMAEKVFSEAGPATIVVNNAGVVPGVPSRTPFAQTSSEEWEPWIRLNLYGVLYVTRAFLPGMLEQKWGRVITVISDAARTGESGMAAYAAAKAGAAGFMRSLATEVSRYGITANCVALGGVKTEHLVELLPAELIERAAKEYPIRRLGEPEEVANTILFLASGAASWTTGQVYAVNGGYSYTL